MLKLISILKINKFRHLELLILSKKDCLAMIYSKLIITVPGNKLTIVSYLLLANTISFDIIQSLVIIDVFYISHLQFFD